MNKIRYISKLIIITLAFMLLASPVMAESTNAKGNGKGISESNKPEPTVTTRTTTTNSRSCLARESAVKTRMAQLVKLVTTMQTTFDKIAGRVETFYTDKVLPSGKTVTNYTVLISDIAARKTDIQTAVDKANADVNGFSCTLGNPKTLMSQFNTDMLAVKIALSHYRTSIKNLIVAVSTVSGDIGETPTPTLSPTLSPTPSI